MTPTAVATIAGLEIRQRIRSTRWIVTAVLLFALVSMLVLGSLYLAVGVVGASYRGWAENLLDIVLGVVLFLGFAAAPTLSATSINGDRRDATLALVQATPISSWDLALGKLLGSWLSSLALIGVALPYLIWGVVSSRTSIGYGVLAVVVLAAIMACYCAIGLGFSALTTRPAASAMLTQAGVLLLLIGLPIAFGFSYPLTAQNHSVLVAQRDYTEDSSVPSCRLVEQDKEFNHTERSWWLLAPNPVLLVSDVLAAGDDAARDGRGTGIAGMLARLQSSARIGPDVRDETCGDLYVRTDDRNMSVRIGDSWFIGLAVTIALGAGGLWTAARRLRVPAGPLPRGVRVA
ncbi:ABC transporter permease [Gordonia humi]|uniref:ABC-type transport system involved in multi-copper enzyme maturation permease subunit n=1 Tax=Gordonia humi TaxID=686429 RepID=A0A840FBM4_9ACTN|nr:ABC transporter permease subunit [Gordonia humi]MBB4137530.1 ABC-type transport system involved in multi-copper enzyme maturation permease subunit [Gordonia humi]